MPEVLTIGSNKHSGTRSRTQLLVIHTGETPLKPGYETSVTQGTNSSSRQASWHIWAGPTKITEMVRHDRIAWHARGANTISIGFEQSGYARFNSEWDSANGKAQVKNLAWAVAREAKRYGIPLRWLTTAEVKKALAGDRAIKGLCRHSQIDPARRSDPGANYPAKTLLSLAKTYLEGKAPEVKPAAGKPPVAKPPVAKPPVSAGGDSIVGWLNAQKRDSSFAARAKLAKQYGISGYTGTAAQNLALLAKLRKGAPAKAPASKPKKVTGSLVDYLNSRKQPSSYSARLKLAAKHGIRNYTGTASQNTALLSKIQD